MPNLWHPDGSITYPMIGSKVVHLLVPSGRPQVFAYELDRVQRILKTRLVLGKPSKSINTITRGILEGGLGLPSPFRQSSSNSDANLFQPHAQRFARLFFLSRNTIFAGWYRGCWWYQPGFDHLIFSSA